MIRRVIGASGTLSDATPVLMHPTDGLRAIIDADQIAAFEWAAARASTAVWNMVAGVREGDDEFTAAARMGYAGDPVNCPHDVRFGRPGRDIDWPAQPERPKTVARRCGHDSGRLLGRAIVARRAARGRATTIS